MAPTAPRRDPDASQIAHQMSVAASRPAARRLQSGAWSRLRSPQLDPLEVYGLPSKGETRLSDFKTQESFHRKIVDRYLRFCAGHSAASRSLESAFASMSLTPQLDLRALSTSAASSRATSSSPSSEHPPAPEGLPSADTPTTNAELALILSAMRKLREGLLASGRTDNFAQRAYLFVVRAALLCRAWEAYVPALTTLLYRVHPITPLPPSELRECIGYTILDLACRQDKPREALEVRARWGLRGRDELVDRVLRCLLRDDWVGWRRVAERVDGYGRALMGFAEERIRINVLKVVGRAYLRIERGVLEEWTGKSWEALVREGVGWEVDGDAIVVRKIKGRTN